jgi:hypothetical protein
MNHPVFWEVKSPKEALRDSQQFIRTEGLEDQIKPLFSLMLCVEKVENKATLICIQHGDQFQITKEEQI